MQLLAVGKSVEAASRGNPYKVVEQGTLPKVDTDSRETTLEVGNSPVTGQPVPATLPLFETPAGDYPQLAVTPVEPMPGGRWVLGRRKKAAVAEVPPAKQRELALESLKVVRNDLRDTDLEFSAKSKAMAEKQVEANPFTPAQIMPPTTMPIWKRWPAQVLKTLRGLFGSE